MKKAGIWLLIAVIILMMTAIHVSAQTPSEQIAEIRRDAGALEKTEDALRAEEITLDAEAKELITMYDTYKKAVRIFNEKASRLTSALSAFKAEINQRNNELDQHERNKPDPYNHDAVRSYNAEADRLDNWRNKLKTAWKNLQERIDDETLVRNGLENSKKKYDKFIMNWAAKHKSLNEKWSELLAKIEKTKSQLTEICKDLMANPNTKNEALKLGCGNVQFDNANPNLPPLEDKDIKPPFEATSN